MVCGQRGRVDRHEALGDELIDGRDDRATPSDAASFVETVLRNRTRSPDVESSDASQQLAMEFRTCREPRERQ
jgi:hypothetical protein